MSKESWLNQIRKHIIQFSVDQSVLEALNTDDDLDTCMSPQDIFVLVLLKLNLDVSSYPDTLKHLASLGLVNLGSKSNNYFDSMLTSLGQKFVSKYIPHYRLVLVFQSALMVLRSIALFLLFLASGLAMMVIVIVIVKVRILPVVIAVIVDVLSGLLFIGFSGISSILFEIFTDSLDDSSTTHINVLSGYATKYNYLRLALKNGISINRQYASFKYLVDCAFKS